MRTKNFCCVFAVLFLLIIYTSCSYASFVPDENIIPVRMLKPGMNGYVLTVIKGYDRVKLPVKIISISPNKPGIELTDEILIQFTGPHKLSQGMSGSPLYINGKLAGAIRSGWNNTTQKFALVTPIESMMKIFDYHDERSNRNHEVFTDIFTLSGLNINTPSVKDMLNSLGINAVQGISSSGRTSSLNDTDRLRPGDSISALLVWGDIELGAVGTVTATDRQGRFIAFGHSMLKRGNASYMAARTFIHDTIESYEFPFKLASAEEIVGSITQDREAGIAGRFAYYAQSIPASLVFRDLDAKTERRFNFRVAADEFMSHKLLEGVCKSLAEEAWGRKGQGTMRVNIRIEGRNVPKGWSRSEIFFSEDNIISSAFAQAVKIINAYLTQPFSETMPVGFTLTVEATQQPKVLVIEDIETVKSANAGEEIEVTVKLREWRKGIIERKFNMTIPESASGVTELIVRGGSSEPLSPVSIEEGLMSINSLERMLTELKAIDANNELIIELNNDNLSEALKKAMKKKHNRNSDHEPDLLPEEEEFLSETKTRRIKEGTLKIYSTEYFIDGMMKRLINVHND